MQYESAFFIVPTRIMNLPNITLAQIKIYETIFQFWNHGKQCYLTNGAIKERTGISSESTIREALIFFEKHSEVIRIQKNGRRYLIQPERRIELVDSGGTPVDAPTPPQRCTDAPPLDRATHNNKNINNKNINNIYSASEDAHEQEIINSFNKFWNAYPKKIDKQKAFKVWKKEKLHERLTEIVADVDQRKAANWLHKDKQFIPNASTYLNGQRWNDEIYKEQGSANDDKARRARGRELQDRFEREYLEALEHERRKAC